LGLLTCKNLLPYNLYCVGGDLKHCTINQYLTESYINIQTSDKVVLYSDFDVVAHVMCAFIWLHTDDLNFTAD